MTDSALIAAPVLSEDSRRILDGLMVVRETLAPDLTPGELQLFALVASRSGLDPFARQIYAVKRMSRGQSRMAIQTGIDGYRSIAARTGEYDGQDEPIYGPDCGCGRGNAHPEYATVRVYRKGMSRPVGATAFWHEYVPDAGQSGQGDVMWRKMPHVMVAKVAEALALRKAFPWDPNSGKGIGSDIYTTEEMAQTDNAPVVVSTVQERIAAKAELGASLRYFADAVRELDPDAIRTARQEMYPEATGVAALTDDQRQKLLDHLFGVTAEVVVEVTEDGTGTPQTGTQPVLATDISAPEPVIEVIEPEPFKQCRAVAPLSGEQCGLASGHKSIHRVGDTEGWPRKRTEEIDPE